MIHWGLVLLAVLAGSMVPLQAGVNAELSRALGHPLQAALISFSGGVLVIAVCLLLTGSRLPAVSGLAQAPVWAWTGGLLGAVMVVTSIYLAPRIGAVSLISCYIAGQLTASVLFDHFGLVGYRAHPLNPERILGIILLVTGALLIRKY